VLDVELAARLVKDVKATIEPKEDRAFVVYLCAACAKRLTRLGQSVDVPGEETVFIA
jgi:CRISPR/Cas system-associated endoribonuclease Cas2